MSALNCDHCKQPIESQYKLKIAIRPFRYFHYHNDCYSKLSESGQSTPLALPVAAVQSLAISTLIPAFVLLLLPILASLIDGRPLNLITAYGEYFYIALLGVFTLLLSLFHWRELIQLKKRFR